jgi:hypothetical protein
VSTRADRHSGKRPVVFLVADGSMQQLLEGFFGRERFHNSLGCGHFDFRPESDIVVAPFRDSHVYQQARQLLSMYEHSHQHAVVMVDAQWDGNQGTTADIRKKIEDDLSGVWAEYHVAVLDPELEAWFWQDSPHVADALRYRGNIRLREVLADSGHWPRGQAKPTDPKGAVKYLRRRYRTVESPAIFRHAAAHMSVRSCVDPAFNGLKQTLATWFPET